jgi:urease accessory protein
MTSSRATVHRSAGQWPENLASDSLSLDFDARHRRRIQMTSEGGEDVLLDLPKAVPMSDGDGLQLEDGRWLCVRAAPELVVRIVHEDPIQLTRIAWHLGNRHLPTQVGPSDLRIRPDHVIELLLQRLGASLANVEVAFQPEGGAYTGGKHHAFLLHQHE